MTRSPASNRILSSGVLTRLPRRRTSITRISRRLARPASEMVLPTKAESSLTIAAVRNSRLSSTSISVARLSRLGKSRAKDDQVNGGADREADADRE